MAVLYSTTVLADNPKAYYRMDEGSGTIAHDSTTNHYDATLTGSFTLNQTGAITGDTNTAILFSTARSALNLPYTLNYTTFTALSIEFWVNTASAWHHIVMTCNGPTTLVYYDGNVTTPGTPASIEIDSIFSYAGSYLSGYLDEVAIYNKVLSAATILNHYTIALAASPPVSIYDLAYTKHQMVMVYDRNGRFIDTWRDAPLLAGFKESINAATTPLRVQLPRPFDNYDLAGQPGSRGTIAQGNIVQYRIFGPGLPTTGKIRYQGIIDAFQPQITESGEESVLVTITPQSSVIADHGLGGGQMFGQTGISASYVDPITMFNWWFQNIDPLTGRTYTYPLTLNASNPVSSGVAYSYPFINQNLQSIFNTILQMLPPNWYYRINADLSVTLQQAPTLAQNTFVIGRHIAAPTYTQDWTQLKNVIYLLGAQTDTTTTGDLNLKGVQSTPAGGTHLVSIVSGSDVSIFGERLLLTSDTRVLDQTTLNALAAAQLAALDQMQLRTTVRLIDFRGDSRPNIGYDIESINVGDTCVLSDPLFVPTSTHANAYWDVAQWDTDWWTYLPVTPLNQVVTIAALTYNFDYVDLELANLQPSQDAALGRIRQQFQDFSLL